LCCSLADYNATPSPAVQYSDKEADLLLAYVNDELLLAYPPRAGE
jgi:hypothetical protein